MKHRLHLVALPWFAVDNQNTQCAYTQKVRRFVGMMTSIGNEVVLYSNGLTTARPTEHVMLSRGAPGVVSAWSITDPHFAKMNTAVIAAIRARIGERDLICLIGGSCQAPIADAFPAHQVVEWGIGYAGTIARSHKVFESYAWMHTVLGQQYGAYGANGVFFDTVIPNSFDVSEFPVQGRPGQSLPGLRPPLRTPSVAQRDTSPKREGSQGLAAGDYYLYVGRLIERKGLQIAAETCKRIGARLVIAGEGDFRPGYGEYVGHVDAKKRAELMGGAIALFAPSLYVEPFGGVHAEAQLCGTPVITTDFGVYAETVEDGVNGFRCSTLAEFIQAAEDVKDLDRQVIRDWALSRWDMNVVKHDYQRYFDRLATLWGDGWYEPPSVAKRATSP